MDPKRASSESSTSQPDDDYVNAAPTTVGRGDLRREMRRKRNLHDWILTTAHFIRFILALIYPNVPSFSTDLKENESVIVEHDWILWSNW